MRLVGLVGSVELVGRVGLKGLVRLMRLVRLVGACKTGAACLADEGLEYWRDLLGWCGLVRPVWLVSVSYTHLTLPTNVQV